MGVLGVGQVWVFWVVGWTRESGGGRARGGWIDVLVYLVSVGGWCACVYRGL